jgi:hypothetical protein
MTSDNARGLNMQKLEIGPERDLIARADSPTLDPAIYRETGFFVVRNVIPEERIRVWQDSWNRFYSERLAGSRKVDPFNPVQVHEPAPADLAAIHQCPELLDVLEVLYPDLALFMQRFLIKYPGSSDPVFVHNDFAYDYGFQDKTTVFLALSPSNFANGGISFYPGTHHFGYLGDAGEANIELLSPDWPLVCPDLEPGDIALCHTCTWHCSPPHSSGPPRILVQSTFQPSSDPSSTALLRGQWRTRYRLSQLPRERFFARCRSSRLRELQRQIDIGQ